MMANPDLWRNVVATTGAPKKRLAFAVVFAAECFDVIVRHELAHLVLGHCEFLARTAAAGTANPLTAQALEVAADGHAAVWGAQRLSIVPQTFGRLGPLVKDAYREFHRSSDEAVRNYLLAVFFVFRLMDESTWTSSSLAGRPHPPAPIRFHVACLHLHEYLSQTGNARGQEQLARALDGLWELGEFIFSKTLERTPDLCAKRKLMEVESERHYALMHDHAQTIPQHLFGLS
jgi:hypothetical protein